MDQTPAPPVPITHPAHPIWAGFTWDKFLHVLQIAATVAPVVVGIADSGDPNAVAEAKQFGDLANVIIGGLGE